MSRLAIAWTLANPAVQVAIVGARHPGHIEDSVAAAELEPERGRSRADRAHHGRLRRDGWPAPGDDARSERGPEKTSVSSASAAWAANMAARYLTAGYSVHGEARNRTDAE